MSWLDRFKPKAQRIGQEKKPKNLVGKKDAARAADEEKRRQFAAVPAAGRAERRTEKTTPAKSAPKRRSATGEAYRILYRAVISEKATRLSPLRQYVFAVSPSANKVTIKKAVEALYGVRPERVSVVNVGGKQIRYGRTTGRTKHWKKAVVTVPPGKQLDLTGT